MELPENHNVICLLSPPPLPSHVSKQTRAAIKIKVYAIHYHGYLQGGWQRWSLKDCDLNLAELNAGVRGVFIHIQVTGSSGFAVKMQLLSGNPCVFFFVAVAELYLRTQNLSIYCFQRACKGGCFCRASQHGLAWINTPHCTCASATTTAKTKGTRQNKILLTFPLRGDAKVYYFSSWLA